MIFGGCGGLKCLVELFPLSLEIPVEEVEEGPKEEAPEEIILEIVPQEEKSPEGEFRWLTIFE